MSSTNPSTPPIPPTPAAPVTPAKRKVLRAQSGVRVCQHVILPPANEPVLPTENLGRRKYNFTLLLNLIAAGVMLYCLWHIVVSYNDSETIARHSQNLYAKIDFMKDIHAVGKKFKRIDKSTGKVTFVMPTEMLDVEIERFNRYKYSFGKTKDSMLDELRFWGLENSTESKSKYAPGSREDLIYIINRSVHLFCHGMSEYGYKDKGITDPPTQSNVIPASDPKAANRIIPLSPESEYSPMEQRIYFDFLETDIEPLFNDVITPLHNLNTSLKMARIDQPNFLINIVPTLLAIFVLITSAFWRR